MCHEKDGRSNYVELHVISEIPSPWHTLKRQIKIIKYRAQAQYESFKIINTFDFILYNP